MAIGRQRLQAWVVDGATTGEMVDRLPGAILQSEQLVSRVVKEATDASGTDIGRLGFQVEHLPNQARFPVQPAVRCRAGRLNRGLELSKHGDREGPIGGDVLV